MIDGDDKASETELRGKIDALVTKLPAGLVYTLLSEIEHMDQPASDRAQLVRGFVIDYLNRQRPNRARRLFTSLFEHFLIDDEALYHAGQPIPLAVQRADVGALWEVLSHEAFPLLAVQCQESLDMMAREELLDRALRSPAAMDLREQMRTGAIRYLKSAFASRKALEGLVAEMTRNRTRRSKLLSSHINRSPPFAAETLHGMMTILERSASDDEELIRSLDGLPEHAPDDEGGRETVADRLADLGHTLALGEGEAAAELLELTALNVRRLYEPLGHLLHRREPDALRGDKLAIGLTGHFLGVARAFTAILMGVLRLNERADGATVRASARDRARLDGLLERLGRLVAAVGASGLRDDRLTEPQFELAWEAASKVINTRVTAVSLERASLAASARKSAASDHGDVIWLMDLVRRWHDVSLAFGVDAFDLVKWRETLLDEMRANVDKAMRFAENEGLEDRWQHLIRIGQLCHVFGQTPTEWIAPSSHNMTRLVVYRLNDETPITPEERRLMEATIQHARDEIARSRYWKSHDLVQMIEMGERRLAAVPVLPAPAGAKRQTAT